MQCKGHSPCNVRRIEDTQPDRILVIIDANIFLESEDTRVANVGAVDEGAEEQQGEDGEDAGSVSCALNSSVVISYHSIPRQDGTRSPH
jgi:hypothetical protein